MIPACRRLGTGPALVCHPGGPGFSSGYFGGLGGLGSAFELILVDPRGTGETSAPADDRAYSAADYAADLDELRAALGFERINLLGHSHGGVVAIAYAAAYPERVRRLVLASTLARLGEPQRLAMSEAMSSRAAEPWYEDATRAIADEEAERYSTPEELAGLVARMMPFYYARFGERERAHARELRSERPNPDALKLFNEGLPELDLRPDLARIRAETLVITGRQDFITGPACSTEVAAGIDGAEHVILEDCGHFLFVEQPQAFVSAVEAFLLV